MECPLVTVLCSPKAYPHAPEHIELVETHISWIFLAGEFAYKIKKPLNLGFLDFSTLELRHHYCLEELRLNRRLCPDLYRSVVPIVQCNNTVLVDGNGEIIDYAVKMVRFDRTMELDKMVAQKLLTNVHIEQLASLIATFHTSLQPTDMESDFGLPETLIKPMLHNFTAMEEIPFACIEREELEALRQWTISEHQRITPLLLERKQRGFIRQCHGDLHTGNMVLWKEQMYLFDCIEFNHYLSNIDVISDLAFLFMDLQHRGASYLAWLLLNRYLMATGDYKALSVFRFYLLYRAMVRAKVTAIRYHQTSGEAAQQLLEEHRSYIRQAVTYTKQQQPMLLLTYGVSGSGKTTLATVLSSVLPCLHIRSDIERKRLVGLQPLERGNNTNILYNTNMSEQTYQRLLDSAMLALQAGMNVLVDATFLRYADRQRFIVLAEGMQVPCRILHCVAPESLLMERVQQRYKSNNDASDADTNVLAMQLAAQEALTHDEQNITIVLNTEEIIDAQRAVHQLKAIM